MSGLYSLSWLPIYQRQISVPMIQDCLPSFSGSWSCWRRQTSGTTTGSSRRERREEKSKKWTKKQLKNKTKPKTNRIFKENPLKKSGNTAVSFSYECHVFCVKQKPESLSLFLFMRWNRVCFAPTLWSHLEVVGNRISHSEQGWELGFSSRKALYSLTCCADQKLSLPPHAVRILHS